MTDTEMVAYPSVEGAESPWEFLDYLRDNAPVHQIPDRPNLFVVTRYEDARRVFSEPQRFSSTGTRAALYGFDPMLGTAPGESRLMTEFDPPALKPKRDLGFAALKPGKLRAYEPMILDIVEDLIDAFEPRGSCEFIDEFARALPTRLTVGLMGVSEDDVPFVQKWARFEASGLVFMPTEFQENQRRVAHQMSTYVTERVLERHADPQEDVISEIATAQVARDGELDLAEVTSVVSALLIGGIVTTGHFVGSMMLLLAQHPDDQSRLRANPSLIPKAIEEGLRVEPPALWHVRRVVAETELGGVSLPVGSVLLVMNGAANRDSSRFACPAHFDLERANSREHVAFGYGPHSCLGAPLARLELRIGLERLLARLDNIRLAPGGELTHLPSPHFRGFERLDLEFTSRR
jgi:cytochrome P450